MPDVSMPFALAADGMVARADTAPRGEVYHCLDCQARVKVRRGPKRAPHFSHIEVTHCTGEGVVHWAAKMELRRALSERARPFTLLVPCAWPGCPCMVPTPFDPFLGGYTEAVNEKHFELGAGDHVQFDVATLLHGAVQVAFEVYHHHSKSDEWMRKGLPNWVEVHAEPLLTDPYQLVMVKRDRPVDSVIEAGRTEPWRLRGVTTLQDVYGYRARGSGRWIEDAPNDEDVDLNEFDAYTCPEHAQAHNRLLNLWVAEHLPPAPEETHEEPAGADPLAAHMDAMRRSATFAARMYEQWNVPASALTGLNLRACRCPKCAHPSVFVTSSYVPKPQVKQFGSLLGFTRHADSWELNSYCCRCAEPVRREDFQGATGYDLPGDLVASAMRAALP